MDRRTEDRMVPREYEDALVEIMNESESWKGWVVDISAGGLRALIPDFKEFLDPGESVTGWIFGRTTEEIKIHGKISWVKDHAEEAGHHVGVAFSSPIRPPEWVLSASSASPISFALKRNSDQIDGDR